MSAEMKIARRLLFLAVLCSLSAYGHGWAAALLKDGPSSFCAAVSTCQGFMAAGLWMSGLFNLADAYSKEGR